MPAGFFHINQPHHLRIRTATAFNVLRDVSDRLDRQSFGLTWDLDSLITSGSFTLWVPVGADDYDIEVWREVRIDDNSLTQSTRNERYFRGFISDVDTWEEGGLKYYQIKIVDGNVFFNKSPGMITYPATFEADDLPWDDRYFVSTMASVCMPGEEYDITTIGLHYTWADPETYEPFTIQNMTFGEGIKALQDYIGRNTPPESDIPQALITWGRDEEFGGDSDLSWRWKINWFTWAEIDTFALKLTDDNAESALAAHYYSFRRIRAGMQMINRQYVVGFDWETGEPIEYTANNTTSQDYYNRVISGKPILDEEAATLEEVTARAEAELEKWSSAAETLSGIKVLYPFILGSPAKILIKNANEGGLGDYTEYILSACSMSVNGAGLVEFDLTLGAAFPQIGERGSGWRGGARFNRDVVPPHVILWRNTAEDIVENQYFGPTHSVTVTVAWIPSEDHDIRDYLIKYRLDGGEEYTNLPPVPASGAPSFTIRGLAPREPDGELRTIEFAVRGRDSHGNIQQTWSAWRNVNIAYRDAPAAPTDLHELTTGADAEGGFAYVAWTNSGDPHSQHDIWYWPSTNPFDQRRIRLPHGSPVVNSARISGAMQVGVTYGMQIRSVTEWDDPGPWSASISVLIEPNDPPAPTGFALNTTVNGTGYGWDDQGAYVALQWTPPVVHDHYHLEITDESGPITYIIRDWTYIPGGWAGILVQGLPRATTLTYRLKAGDAYGYESSTPATLTINVPNETPAPPTGITLIASGTSMGRDGVIGGWATFSYTPSAYPAASYLAHVSRTTGTWKRIYPIYRPPDNIVRLDNLPVNVPLQLQLQTASTWGPYIGAVSSAVGPFLLGQAAPTDPPGFGATIDGDNFPAWTSYASMGSPPEPTLLTNAGYKGSNAMRFSLTGAQSLSKAHVGGWEVAPGIGVLTLAIRADHLTNIVGSAIIDYYTAAGILIAGGSSTLTIPAILVANVWQEFEQTVTVPSLAATARLRVGATHLVGGTNMLDYSIVRWMGRIITAIALGVGAVTAPALGLGAVTAPAIGPAAITAPALGAGAVTTPAISPAAIKPSALDVGLLAGLYNGDLEIGNQAATMADGWDATGPVTWQTTTAASGAHALLIGGSAGTATVLSPYFLWVQDDLTAGALRVRFKAGIQSGGGPLGTKTVKVRFFDSAKNVVGTDIALRNNADTGTVAMVFSSTAPYLIEGMIPFNYVPASAVYARIVWSIGTTGTGDTGYLDSLQVDLGNDSISVSKIQFRDPGNIGGGGSLLAQQTMGSILPTAPITGDRHFHSTTGIDLYYDGTRWLGPEMALGGWEYYPAAQVGVELTATQEYMNTALRQDVATRVVRLAYHGYVNGTNNGFNYWKLHLRTFTAQVDLESIPANTSSWTGATWTFPSDVTTFANQPAVSAHGLQWYIEKVGSPGPLRFYYQVYVRQVYP